MIVKRFGCTEIHKLLYYIDASFIHFIKISKKFPNINVGLKTNTTGLINMLNTYRSKDFTNGRFNLELCGSAVHVPTNHVSHGLSP